MEVAGYHELVLVGSGGNAHVYRAKDDTTGAVVAIKILRGGGDESVTRRFERERTLMAELENIASVVPIHESGVGATGDPYLVMPLYTGGSLQDRVASSPMPWREAVTLTKRMSESIALAHAKRILHLDIKPANVLLDNAGEPWLADFGIAEMMGNTTSMSAQMMTPAFTPPERLDGAKPSEQTDLYGLVATLFALMTGSAPYITDAATGPMSVMMAVLRDPLSLDGLATDTPESVRNLLMRGMAKDPRDRPRSAIELVGLLDDILEGRKVEPLAAMAARTDDVSTPVLDSGNTVFVDRSASQAVLVASTTDNEQDSSRRGALVFAGLAVALLIAGGGIAALVLGGGDDPADEVQTAAQPVDDGDESAAETEGDDVDAEEVAVEVSGAGQSIVSEESVSQTLGEGFGDDTEASTQTSEATTTSRAATPTTATAGPTTTERAAPTTTTERAAPTTASTTSTSTTSTSSTSTTPTTREPEVTVPPLEAGFVASNGSEGAEQTISFSNITEGTATSYRWDFGDGNTSTQRAPSHTYAMPGRYSVTVTATGPGGSDSATHPVQVTANSVQFEAGWTASASPSPNQQTLNFRSITIGPVTSLTWDFGDGGTGTGANPSHTYDTPGSYTVTITATGSEGTDTATHSVRVEANG